MTVADVLERFEGVRRSGRGWTARCPAHNDHRPSLSIAAGREGRILLHCFARQCDYHTILWLTLGVVGWLAYKRSACRQRSGGSLWHCPPTIRRTPWISSFAGGRT
jgi:CHC2 zinc finger